MAIISGFHPLDAGSIPVTRFKKGVLVSEFVWNICLIRLRIKDRIWRIRLGWANPLAEPRGWNKICSHLFITLFSVER